MQFPPPPPRFDDGYMSRLKHADSSSRKFHFIERKEKWVLTRWGKLCTTIIIVVLFFLFLRGIHPFLSINSIIPGEIQIVEGWVPDYALDEIVKEFKTSGSNWLLTTGGPIEQGSFLTSYKSYAELSRATLLTLGLPAEKVIALPAPFVLKDRTYTSAAACKTWIEHSHPEITQFTIYTMGPHARRTQLLYRKAFGSNYMIGVRALEPNSYDSTSWWQTSAGVRTVLSETIAYLYGMIFSLFTGSVQ